MNRTMMGVPMAGSRGVNATEPEPDIYNIRNNPKLAELPVLTAPGRGPGGDTGKESDMINRWVDRLGTATVAVSVPYFVILGLAVVGGLLVHDIATNGFAVG